MGLDTGGRVVLPVSDWPESWRLYDVLADRSRPLRGVPATDCPMGLGIWRSRVAYGDCKRPYLRIGSRVRRVPVPPDLLWWGGGGGGGLTLRGQALFAQTTDGSDGTYVSLLADGSGPR